MVNTNPEILNRIKNEFSIVKNKNSGSLKLPTGINFDSDGNTVKMKLSASAVCLNMQENNCAFEGWALILKRWGKYEQIIISWDKPDVTNGHYERLLFRLKHFEQDYSWFSIDNDYKILLEESKLKISEKFLLNLPGLREDKDTSQKEAALEKRFVGGDLKEHLIKISNATHLYKQLPVGVFKSTVSKKDSIFTYGKSAIDIWGFNKSNELLVFELKVKDNKKVGIISELYFYVCVLRMIQKRTFGYQNCTKENEHLLEIEKTKIIRAYFLAPELHPLVDNEILKLLNNVNSEISYHYINFNEEYKMTLDIFN